MRTSRFFAVFLTLAPAACGSDADVAGSYSISITNGENGCNFANWTVGETAANIPITMTQTEANVTADVGGVAALGLDLLLASHTFVGSVSGDRLALEILGTRSQTSGNCTLTYNANLDATIDGDVLTGTLRYTPATNGNPDCATIVGCVNQQAFNGTRPPQ